MNRDTVNGEELKRAAKENRLEQYLSSHLSADTAGKLKSILSDKKKTSELMNTPEAQKLLNKLKRDK